MNADNVFILIFYLACPNLTGSCCYRFLSRVRSAAKMTGLL